MIEMSGGQPRLKNYIFFKETAEGVLFDGGMQSFVLHGTNVYPLVSKVIHLMDAGHPYDQIARSIPERAKPVFNALMEALQSHRMLIDGAVERGILAEYPGGPPFVEILHYLQDHLGDYQAAFARWRDTTVALIGNGFALKAAVNGLVTSGVGRLHVAITASAETRAGVEEITEILETQAAVDAAFRYRVTPVHALGDAATGDAALVLYVSDDLGAQDGQQELVSHATEHSVPYVVAGVAGGRGIVSPPSAEGYADVRDLLEVLTPVPDLDPEGMHSPASCAVIGSIASLIAIRECLRVDHARLQNHAFVVSPFLDVSHHPLLPAPTIDRGANLLRTVFAGKTELPRERALSRYEQIKVDLQPLFDPITGYFNGDAAKHLAQLPLCHDAITVRFPRSLRRPPETVLGWGVDAEDAGRRTIKRALGLFANATVSAPGPAIVAEFDEQSWVEWAAAAAVVTSESFARRASHAVVHLDEVDDQSVQLLLRLLRLYTAATVQAHLYWIPGTDAYWARCLVDQRTISTAMGLSATEAIVEALGNACSSHQFPEHPAWHDPTPPEMSAMPDDTDAAGVHAAVRAPARRVLPPLRRHLQSTGVALMTGIYAGHVELGDEVAHG